MLVSLVVEVVVLIHKMLPMQIFGPKGKAKEREKERARVDAVEVVVATVMMLPLRLFALTAPLLVTGPSNVRPLPLRAVTVMPLGIIHLCALWVRLALSVRL